MLKRILVVLIFLCNVYCKCEILEFKVNQCHQLSFNKNRPITPSTYNYFVDYDKATFYTYATKMLHIYMLHGSHTSMILILLFCSLNVHFDKQQCI